MTMRISKGLRCSSSLQTLRAIAQPPEYSPSRTDGPYRACSIFLSVPLARLGATPNGITVAWIALGLTGAAMLVSPSWVAGIGGALLLELSYLLDFVDGEVARLTSRQSLLGGLLDLVGHGLIKTSLPLSTGMGAALATGAWWFIGAGAVGAVALGVGDSVRFYAACTSGNLESGDLAHTAPLPFQARRLTVRKFVGSVAALSFESPGLYGLTLIAALANRLDVLTLYWAIVGPVWLVWRTVRYARRLAPPASH